MDVDHHLVLGADLPQRFPVGVMDARLALQRRVVGEGNGVAALGNDALDLGHRGIDVPVGNDGVGDVAARVAAAPLVDVPVVVGLQQGEGVLLVFELME
ncbi:hypothetical protein D9M68_663950 [compost metagenome]